MSMYELAASPALKQSCFPDPDDMTALALVRCRRDEDQWLLMLQDIWQHTNKIVEFQTANEDIKKALRFNANNSAHVSHKIGLFGQWLNSLDPAELQYAPTFNITNQMVSLHPSFVLLVLFCTHNLVDCLYKLVSVVLFFVPDSTKTQIQIHQTYQQTN